MNNFIYGLLLVGIVIILVRLVLCKTIWEKLLSYNIMAILIVMLSMTYAVFTDNLLIMDIVISYAIIGFLLLVLLTTFIGAGGSK